MTKFSELIGWSYAWKIVRPMAVILCALLWSASFWSSAAIAWDAGPKMCKHKECRGGAQKKASSVPDTQPKYAKSKPLKGTGRVADCPKGYTNNGATCGRGGSSYKQASRVADCPSGYTNNGANCGRGGSSYKQASRVADCPSGYTNNGANCGRGAKSYKASSRVANCPKGWTNMGAHCGKGLRTKGLGSMVCKKGYFKKGARCYKSCKSGYSNTGETCYRKASSKSLSSMKCEKGYFKKGARCYKSCKSGYTNTGETCYRKASSKSLKSMTCKKGYFKNGARCYKSCKSGYTNTGEYCHQNISTKLAKSMTCKKGEVKSAARCYTNRDCARGYRVWASLCYAKCPTGSVRTAVSTCTHKIKWRGNTHRWIVNQALIQLARSKDPVAKRAVATMRTRSLRSKSPCHTAWEQGLWDADDVKLKDTPDVKAGSHFYNASGKDAWGKKTRFKTYAIGGVDAITIGKGAAQSPNVGRFIAGKKTKKEASHGNAREEAKKRIKRAGRLKSRGQCYELGVALHYMTDMTQPMHATSFSGLSSPLMMHPVMEMYIATKHHKYRATKWRPVLTKRTPDQVFRQTSLDSAKLAPKMTRLLVKGAKGTICTTPVAGETAAYTGKCFFNDRKVDGELGKILRAGYKATANYIYAVFKHAK